MRLPLHALAATTSPESMPVLPPEPSRCSNPVTPHRRVLAPADPGAPSRDTHGLPGRINRPGAPPHRSFPEPRRVPPRSSSPTTLRRSLARSRPLVSTPKAPPYFCASYFSLYLTPEAARAHPGDAPPRSPAIAAARPSPYPAAPLQEPQWLTHATGMLPGPNPGQINPRSAGLANSGESFPTRRRGSAPPVTSAAAVAHVRPGSFDPKSTLEIRSKSHRTRATRSRSNGP